MGTNVHPRWKLRSAMNKKLLAALVLLCLLGFSLTTVAADPDLNSDTETVDIENFAFSPNVVEVLEGTTVTWTNLDADSHTVTADDGAFDSGLLAQGESFSYTFDALGTFSYHCTPHPSMTGDAEVTELSDWLPGEEEETPGFGLLVGLLSLSVVAIALRPRD